MAVGNDENSADPPFRQEFHCCRDFRAGLDGDDVVSLAIKYRTYRHVASHLSLNSVIRIHRSRRTFPYFGGAHVRSWMLP